MFGWFSKAAPVVERAGDEVGCFGKMPIHGDFIRHNVRLRETAALDVWIQEGTSFLARTRGSAWPDAFRNFPGTHFVLTGGEQERTVIGTLIGSRDRGGRGYPFLIFCALDDPLFRQMQAVAPLYYSEFFGKAEEICGEKWSSEPVSLLLSRVDSLFRRDDVLTRRLLLERQISALEKIESGRFWEGVLPAGDHGARERLFASVFDALRQIARRGASRIHWGLRLPLPSEADLRPFVVFWVQLIESALEDRTLRAHYFWNRSGEEGGAGLTVFFRPPPASYLLPVIEPEGHDGTLFDPLRETPSTSFGNPDLRKMLGSDEASLLEILYRFGRREILG